MLDRISNQLAYVLAKNEIIPDEQHDVYSFGIKSLIFKAISIMFCFVIGLCFNMLIETSIFLITFSMIRVYAGGYHAKTRMRCFLISMQTMIVFLFILKMSILQNLIVYIILLASSCISIYIFAPSDTENKKLDNLEIVKYSRITLVMMLILVAISLLLLKFNIMLGSVIVETLCVQAVMILFNRPQKIHFTI
jgi:accessory gene regulator B